MAKKEIEVVLVAGRINSGKTTSLLKLLELERANSNSPSGIIAHGVFENGVKIGFDVEDISSGHINRLARIRAEFQSAFQVGKYAFSCEGFEFAKAALLQFKPGGIVFIDEAGPLELKGQGYADCLRTLLKSDIAKIYIAVRKECLSEFTKKYLDDIMVRVIEVNQSS